jgi:hypothetical protein
MSVAATTEAEDAHHITNDPAVAQFNGGLLDSTTGIASTKEFMKVDAGDNDTVSSRLKDASTEAGADNIEGNEVGRTTLVLFFFSLRRTLH